MFISVRYCGWSVNDGKSIMISETVDRENRMFMNVMESMKISVKKEGNTDPHGPSDGDGVCGV